MDKEEKKDKCDVCDGTNFVTIDAWTETLENNTSSYCKNIRLKTTKELI